jgi:hypothetical protein
MLLYIENHKDYKTVGINKFSKIAEYRIIIQKSVAFLYTNNELSKRGKKTIPFIRTTKLNTLK